MKKKILITTGGSGGHVIPSLAIYDHLKDNYEISLITDLRGSKFIRDKKYDPSFRDKRSNHFTESNHINLAIYIKRLFNNEPVNDIKFNENVI